MDDRIYLFHERAISTTRIVESRPMHHVIEIKLFASLQAFSPAEAASFPISPNQTVEDILKTLNVPLETVKLVFVNGVKADLDTLLKNGDRVGVFPAVGGG